MSVYSLDLPMGEITTSKFGQNPPYVMMLGVIKLIQIFQMLVMRWLILKQPLLKK